MHRIRYKKEQVIGLVFSLCLGALAPCPAAWDPAQSSALSRENGERVQQAYASQVDRYKADRNMLVLPGLLADRGRQRVEILAESTGLASNSIVEFLLISQASRHGYEAIAVSFAKPSDIHQALVFIGMAPGEPYNPQQTRVWPKGERVLMSCVSGAGTTSTPVRVEKLVLNTRTGQSLPETGFVFTGSRMVPAGNGSAGKEYGADVCEPQAIVSVYNDPYAVLDVGRMARQSDVYGTQLANPKCLLPKGALLTVSLEPEYKDGRKRVKDLVLEAVPASPASKTVSGQKPSRSDAEPGTVAFKLQDLAGKDLLKEPSLPGVRQALESLVGQGCDPFVSVRFGRELRLDTVCQVCRDVAVLDNVSAMRVEPPGISQLYYRAFLADEQWRKREGRSGQPWELVVVQKGGTFCGKLVLVENPGWGEMPDAELKITEFDIPDSTALRRELEADAASRKQENKQPHLPVVLVFADPALTYGRLVEFINPVLSSSYVVYVFLQSP